MQNIWLPAGGRWELCCYVLLRSE